MLVSLGTTCKNMNSKTNSAKFAFYYLLGLVALIFTAQSTGMIIFQIINKYIRDVINEYSAIYSDDAMKFAISAIVIAAPIYYVMKSLIMKNLKSGELEKDSQIRKWLSYLVILVSSVVMIGWLIGTINGFLNGELSLKFFLKALVAIVIAAIVFSFYFYDIRRKNAELGVDKIIKFYFYGSLLLIVVSFFASLFVVESPMETRKRKMDERVVNVFSNLDSAVNRFFSEKQKLPESLDDLTKEYSYLQERDLQDPIENKKIEYKIIGDDKYALCALFRTSNKDNENTDPFLYKGIWIHDAGYQCIEQKVTILPKGSFADPINDPSLMK